MDSTCQNTDVDTSEGHSGCVATGGVRGVDQCEPARTTTPTLRAIKTAAGCSARSLGEYLFFLVTACVVSIVVVSIMRPVTTVPAPTPATLPTMPVSTHAAGQTTALDQPALPKWCWCRALDANGVFSKKCIIAGSPEEDYCICRCPATEAQTKPSGSDNFLERVAFAFVLLSLPFILAAMFMYDFHL